MHISTSQSFVHRQSMVVTAQLQQAIRLLQMGNAELQDFIESQAEENPFVDVRAPKGSLPELPSSRTAKSGADDWDRLAALPDTRKPSLFVHVESYVEQLGLAPRQARIAGAFLDALEPSGWLGQSVADVAITSGVTVAEALEVLALLHRIEPAGLFARDLAECLRLQAAELDILDPVLDAVLDNLPMVAAANMAGLSKACGCTKEELRPALRLLRTLDPKPGAQFDAEPEPQMPPDLIAKKTKDGWSVELNRSTLPSIAIRPGDAVTSGTRSHSPEANKYISERLAVARWLARAVAHRNETSLKIGAEILRRQTAFLNHGPSHLVPMTLREVADAVGVHESTVSRVCAGMMIATPNGCLPLKHFFTAALVGNDGASAGSAGAARHLIRQLIQSEDPKTPLSDDEIAKRVAADGIVLARRTVAKYREMMNIPTSSDRRRRAVLQAQSR